MVRLLALVLLLMLAAPAAGAQAKPPTAKQCKKKAIKKIKSERKRAKRVKACKRRAAANRRRRPAVPAAPGHPPAPRVEGGIDDAVVVAVLDRGINPYHWDFLASKMPQHAGTEPGNDLPLDHPATDWLPGFAASTGFASFNRLDLHLEATDPELPSDQLQAEDAEAWEAVPETNAAALHAVWFPGTKVIGAMTFSASPGSLWQGVGAHGVGTTSSVVGNIHGTCPECLLFFVDTGDSADEAEQAIEWAERQPWIDLISNSYGHGGAVPKIYAGSDVRAQRSASERGQTIVFSAGNGIENAYTVTNPTTYSSQKGPDWLITVGAVAAGEDNHYGAEENGGSFLGAGKPVDVSGVGLDYPNAFTAQAIGGTGNTGFSGTSNAAPTVAGLYARSLYLARTRLAGPSRVQAGGVVATGAPVTCGPARADCELADGALTATELRTRLLHGAVHTSAGMTDPLTQATTPPVAEQEFLSEGHGSYFARQAGPDSEAWLAEVDRIVGPLDGSAGVLDRPDGEREWMIVDSYCRQSNWGAWGDGYYVEGATELPPADPAWPIRTAYMATCPGGPTPGA